MLKDLKYKLNKISLERIYFAFIRPIFGNGWIVWDQAPRRDIYFNELEKLQIQVARIVTDTNTWHICMLLSFSFTMKRVMIYNQKDARNTDLYCYKALEWISTHALRQYTSYLY